MLQSMQNKIDSDIHSRHGYLELREIEPKMGSKDNFAKKFIRTTSIGCAGEPQVSLSLQHILEVNFNFRDLLLRLLKRVIYSPSQISSTVMRLKTSSIIPISGSTQEGKKKMDSILQSSQCSLSTKRRSQCLSNLVFQWIFLIQ